MKFNKILLNIPHASALCKTESTLWSDQVLLQQYATLMTDWFTDILFALKPLLQAQIESVRFVYNRFYIDAERLLNDAWSRLDDETLDSVAQTFEKYGFTTAFNKPYNYSITPSAEHIYKSLMIELNKRTYMNQDTIEMLPHRDLTAAINEVYEQLLGFG